jgi:hypothetical protein
MALSAFTDKTAPPDDRTLGETLGRASGLWTDLKAALQAAHGPLVEQWSYAGQAYGWSLRLKEKKRALIYMTPCRGYFLASFALGEKACRAAHERGLAPALLAIVDAAPKYAEGRGVRLPVRRRQDLAGIRRLAAVKAEY